MRSSLMLVLAFALSILCLKSQAQTTPLPGKVLEENGDPVPGATVRFKSQRGGVITKDDGTFTIPSTGKGILVISALGFAEQEINVTGKSQITVSMVKTNKNLDEVVVTAMGIRRSKNTLPYAAQQISGDEANKVRVSNLAQGLSGKVSGLEIRQNNTPGGSVNVIVRGIKSLSSNNQALFVVDGTPLDNSIRVSGGSSNSGLGSGGGYDLGNTASDINPDDIQSINVLKGAAATALYGSRAANGVIMITTKKGRAGTNITVNAGVTLGNIDPSTFVTRQEEYGSGRSDNLATGGFISKDVTGDGVPELIVNTNAPRSWGPKFDPNIMVFQWDAFDPLSPTYHKATPWVAPKHGPEYFFKTAVTNNESVFLDGASNKGSYKLGFTRLNDKGTMPNSTSGRNTINFAATYKLTEQLTVSATANYVQETALGRYASGYDGTKSVMPQFRQYGQVNVDYKEQEEAYNRAQRNITWNWNDPTVPTGLTPFSYNNPYFTVYQNYENDNRNRTYGNVQLNYQMLPWLNIMGRVSVDTYNQFQEERVAVNSIGTPGYTRFNAFFRELNYDLIATVNKDITPDLKFNGLLGVNMRRSASTSLNQSTTGGLIIPGLYAISNSKGAIGAPSESDAPKAVDGYFAGATFTYKDFLSLDGTFRRDRSSTLPITANAYNYYAISGSWQFYEHLKDKFSWMSSGKIRANYATVGNDAPWGSIQDVYDQPNPFVVGSNSSVLFSLPATKNNDQLKPERTNSKEVGLEMSFLKNRIGFDATYYRTNTVDQILAVSTSSATGYSGKYVNAGNVQNQGFEVSIFGQPVKTRNFSWDVTLNWTRNRNKVLSLNNGATNLQLQTFQASISTNATVGQPYGQIFGQTYTYYQGKVGPENRIVTADGSAYVLSTTTTNVLGNFNPDWIGGITNTFRFKNLSLSFLVDVRKGGTVWSLDQYYGQQSGILPGSVGKNDLGNEKRAPVAQGGGIILQGVKADGTVNTTRTAITSGNSLLLPPPDMAFDASYVKLRELTLGYHIPGARFGAASKVIKGMDLQLLGRNLWLIHKNLPMSDPEDGASAGNSNQGLQFGTYPIVRSLGFNVKLQF
ncbi:MAG: SusC/RagA family TonB-linked outer membrane protein [Bacteroidetes bacterium]|nr:SusC/RagA family TonB-linked outer membrane protein [Bacteroidota bacterium]